MPKPEAMLTLCGRLAVYLELAPFPLVDIGLLASRYIVEMNLPSMYFILSKNVVALRIMCARFCQGIVTLL